MSNVDFGGVPQNLGEQREQVGVSVEVTEDTNIQRKINILLILSIVPFLIIILPNVLGVLGAREITDSPIFDAVSWVAMLGTPILLFILATRYRKVARRQLEPTAGATSVMVLNFLWILFTVIIFVLAFMVGAAQS